MFNSNSEKIASAIYVLKGQPVTELSLLVIQGLEYVFSSSQLFSKCIKSQTPFTEHFFQTLARVPEADGGHWFGLFEDLVVFFREKNLCYPEAPVAEVEKQIIDFFEASPEWAKDDASLVSEWYWQSLPRKYLKSSDFNRAF